ncbi:hypothetical protein SUGI_0508110 [Cryptomeria japonica]|uniref:gibberellin 2-beta-dioxygenase 4 n=1 Tax=Cryptomeria japonica TaxID=3369 RepID=UPI002408EB34|nr:gibberellin 2-beta-dioxygenase 4 [Cryptomeria japonica]GLJ26371.1 hypothetical protein SUGI_0508110 [Cryptomeria japonica]
MSSTDVQQQGSSSSTSSGKVVCGSRAPPPTPNQGGNASAIVNSDAFSAFLERSLGIANLVLPESPTKPTAMDRDLPVIDLSGERDEVVRLIRDSAKEFGAFQVVNHGIPWQTVERAEEECKGLFELTVEEKEGICRSFNGGSAFGFDDDTSTSMRQESFWLEKDAEQMEAFLRNIWPQGCVNFSRAMGEYSVAMEKVAGDILDLLLEGLGNWLDRSTFTAQIASHNASLVCITSQKGIPKSQSARIKHSHPCILSTQYQSRDSYAYHLYVDRTWIRVIPQHGALMVTLGDILKVWSNGEFKSVIGRAVGGGKVEEEEEEEESACTCTWMALLYSPCAETTISPILELMDSQEKKPNYSSFALKDYASRLQKQRFMFKDPLDRYKIK